MAIQRSNPEVGYFDLDYLGNGISYVVRSGNTVHLSGLAAATGQGEIVAPGDMAGQMHFILDILAKLLATEGMTLANVVATTTYTVDLAQLLEHSGIFTSAFAEHPPTSTFIEVKGLTSPDLLLEVVVVAADD